MKRLLSIVACGLISTQAFAYTITANTSAVGGSGSWSVYDGSYHAGLRTALADTANFGPGGVVNSTISFQGYAGGTLNLSGSNAFLASWWQDGSVSAAQIAAVQTFFASGGDLILFQDSSASDAFGASLGIATVDGTSNPTTVTAPLDGPFGNTGSFTTNQNGTVGHLVNADITSKGGTICGTNNAGQAVMACFDTGVYGAGYGKLIVVSDIDLISGAYSPAPTYSPLNDKGRLGLNIFAFAATNNVPEPSSFALAGLALLGLGLSRRKPI